jgi:two-component system chemotaxis response regulator CheB|uniref:Protein-glutamate methylesterase/protein-glutamine glutaminase n=1 Tax=Desulfobacca acetoxidans TaxID=60893 RepID=A0A7C3WMS4_9BACT
MTPIKVLVVDDSALMRKHLCVLLQGAGFQVEIARNGQEAVEQVLSWQPDVVTLDVNMPEIDGLTALSLIMAARPTPVVMVSSLTTKGAMATLEALALGAVDYVPKPGGTISLSMEVVAEELLSKVKAAAKARPRPATKGQLAERRGRDRVPAMKAKSAPRARDGAGLVLIGVSTGGPRTLEEILPELPADFPWPLLVVQHMPPNFTSAFAARLSKLCTLQVKEVSKVEEIETGVIYLARGGTDMVVGERIGKLVVMPRPESPNHLWHPSVDLLVESAMTHVPAQRLIGVQLTGMGYDGAKSMAELKGKGGRTIAEAEETAVVFGMPKELIERSGATLVLPSYKIAPQLVHWVN